MEALSSILTFVFLVSLIVGLGMYFYLRWSGSHYDDVDKEEETENGPFDTDVPRSTGRRFWRPGRGDLYHD